ncbi:MAG: transposase [Treponema sp.]|nr:transposase [Treponema sp.]
MKYTTTFKKAVLRKVLSPGNRSVHSVAVELGVGEMTINRWLSQVKDGTINFEQGEENPSGQCNMTEKLNLLLEYLKIPQEQNPKR